MVRDKGFISLLVLGVVIIVLLNLPLSVSSHIKAGLREGVAPLQQVLSVFTFRVKEAVTVLRGMGGLTREAREVSVELVRLRNKVRELSAIDQENVELRNQLHFVQRTDREVIPCEVIGRDVSGWWQSIRISKGLAGGLEVDQAVITSEGLVGKIIDISMRTADILLISDPGCRISARISRTGAFGIVRGKGLTWKGQASCRMSFINKNIPVRPGDEVVTSGLGGVFPEAQKKTTIYMLQKLFSR